MAAQLDLLPKGKRSQLKALWRAARGRCPNCGSHALSWSSGTEGTRCHTCETAWILARANRAWALALVFSVVLGLLISPIIMTVIGQDNLLVSGLFVGMAGVICAARFYRPVRRMLSVFDRGAEE